MTTTTRTPRTDRERALDELDVYVGRLRRSAARRRDAEAAFAAADAEYQAAVDIYKHLRASPALADDRPDLIAELREEHGDELPEVVEPTLAAVAP